MSQLLMALILSGLTGQNAVGHVAEVNKFVSGIVPILHHYITEETANL